MSECCVDEKYALTAILQSVSMQETALAQILNAEAEKLKKAVCMANCIDDLFQINESVQRTICSVSELEQSLREKAIYAIEALNDLRCKKHC